MEANKKDLSKNLKQAPIWQLIDQGAGRFVRIAASVVLARMLFPDDFGIYALSLSILELSRLSLNLGIGSAIVQTKDEVEPFSNSAFWVNLVASLCMFINAVLFSFISASVFDQAILVYTAPVLGITLVSGGFVHINQSLLMRDLEFKVLAKASVAKLAVESLASITLALTGFGVWSFILGYVFGDLVQSVIIWFSTTWRPSLKPDFKYPKKFWKFGANIFLFCFSTYMLEYLPNFIVGRVADAYILGLFAFAWRQSRWIADIPKLIGKNMLFPAFSRLQEEAGRFQMAYERWLRFMLIWGSAIFITQFAFAPLYVPLVFGEKWIPTIAALQILVILAFIDNTFYVPHSEAVTARGKVEKNVYWRIFEAIAVAVTLVIAAPRGPAAIALGMLVVRVGVLIPYLLKTKSVIKVDYGVVIKNIFPTLILCVLGWISVPLIYNYGLIQNTGLLVGLLVSISIIWGMAGLYYVPETKTLVAEISRIFMGIFKSKKQKVALTSE